MSARRAGGYGPSFLSSPLSIGSRRLRLIEAFDQAGLHFGRNLLQEITWQRCRLGDAWLLFGFLPLEQTGFGGVVARRSKSQRQRRGVWPRLNMASARPASWQLAHPRAPPTRTSYRSSKLRLAGGR